MPSTAAKAFYSSLSKLLSALIWIPEEMLPKTLFVRMIERYPDFGAHPDRVQPPDCCAHRLARAPVAGVRSRLAWAPGALGHRPSPDASDGDDRPACAGCSS